MECSNSELWALQDAAEAQYQIVALEAQIKERESVLERRLQLLEEDRALAEELTKASDPQPCRHANLPPPLPPVDPV
jgi:hypothetical protein